MQTIVFIRSVYREEITPLRLDIIRNLVIPAWKAQTDTDFKLVIFCHRNTKQVLQSLDWNGLTVQFIEVLSHELIHIRKNRCYQQLTNAADTLQIRYDNDDYPHHDFIRFTKEQFSEENRKTGLLTYHPTKHVLETGAKYLSQTLWYSAIKPPNCIVIYNEKPDGVGIFEDHHPQMGKYFTYRRYYKIEGFHNMTIHSENLLNKA